jgi:hypothetical protein
MSAAAKDTSPRPLSTPQDKGRRRYVYIGKRLKAWGRLVSVPDPEEGQQQRKNAQQRKRKRAGGRGREHLFAGSEEPLLLAQKRRRAAKKKRRRRQDCHSPSSSFSASASLPPGSSSPVRAVDGDVDEGAWPGEFPMPSPASVVAAVGSVGKDGGYGDQNLKAVLRITPEEVERAIGAAFAVEKQ